MPSYGEHLVVGERESGEEEDYDGLLAVSYGEMGEIAVEAWDIKPGAVFLFLAFDRWLVDISLANIVQKLRDDDTFYGEGRLERRVELNHSLTE